MTSDADQIRSLIATWHAATKAGDVDTVLSLMTDDVVFLVHGRAPISKAEFEALSRGPAGSQRPRIDSSFEIREIHVFGDTAYVWTSLSVSITPPGSTQPMHRAGNTLTIFRREGGRWLLARDANLLAPVEKTAP